MNAARRSSGGAAARGGERGDADRVIDLRRRRLPRGRSIVARSERLALEGRERCGRERVGSGGWSATRLQIVVAEAVQFGADDRGAVLLPDVKHRLIVGRPCRSPLA